MKRVFLHSKRVIGNHWFIICIAGAISFVFGIGLFLIFLAYSLYFKADPVDVNDLMDNFTEEELNIALAETVDETVTPNTVPEAAEPADNVPTTPDVAVTEDTASTAPLGATADNTPVSETGEVTTAEPVTSASENRRGRKRKNSDQ